MKDLDEKIRAALEREDAELFRELGDESTLQQMIKDTFRGKMRFFAWLVMIEILIFTVLMVITAVQFFEAETTRDQLTWAAGFTVCCLATALMKIWWWMEMNKNALLREVKRLELQIARLAQRLPQGTNTDAGHSDDAGA